MLYMTSIISIQQYVLLIQLQSSLKNINFNNGALHEVLFKHGELSIGYDIVNWVIFPNQSFLEVRVGKISPNHEFFIQKDIIVWNNRLQQVEMKKNVGELLL